MSKHIHTIILSDGKGGTGEARRESASRTYACCIVITVTRATVEYWDAKKLLATSDLARAKADLARLTSKLGLTPAQAKAEVKRLTEIWFNDKDGLFVTENRLRGDRYVDVRVPAKADMLARGFVDPWDQEGPEGIVEAAEAIERLTRSLACWGTPAVGSEGVVSWHQSVALGNKALGGREVGWRLKEGYTAAVRTDVKVREVTPRAKRSQVAS
jgi:hypothetical protein